MKISYSWLKDFIQFDESPEQISQILTDIGLEVEGVETFEEIKGGLKNIVVGEVLTCGKHPNADKLIVTTVHVGETEPLNIVCGAPNVAAGQKVVVATVGAEMHMGNDSFVIKKTKLRGEPSEGMICAEDELGLGKSHDGIMVLEANAVIGTPAAEHFNLKTDIVFEIGLTPNRIDAASHFGVARDLATFFSQKGTKEVCKPDVSLFSEGDNSFKVEVEVKDTAACKRYTGVTIKGVNVSESPKWIQERLKAIGLSPINNVVDITNYVLHELGQPLHAFDADTLAGNKLIVQKLADKTKFTTLDEIERELSAEDLMICDAEKGACIAGVFGGADSGVTEKTQNIFLESAYFDAVSVRKTAKRHGLSTDSSFRFERGIDPNITIYALKRAALLISDIAGGKVTSDIIDIYPEPVQPFEVTVKYTHIDRLIGKQLDRGLIKNILSSLEIEILSEQDNVLNLKVPAYRVDVTREADIIEDILRLYGYNNVAPTEKLNASLSPSVKPDNEVLVDKVADMLASNGFNEIMSNSLTKTSYYEDLKSFPADKCVQMLNPLSSDLGVMRQTLLFNGLEAITYNINRQNPNLKLFEYGRCYQLTGAADESDTTKKYFEERRFGVFLSGNRSRQVWNIPESKADFFQLKAYVENLLLKMGMDVGKLRKSSLEEMDDIFAGGLSYKIKKATVANIGVVNPKILKDFGIEQEVVFAELNWDLIVQCSSQKIQFKEMPKFPAVRRDLALLIDVDKEFATIEQLASQTERNLLKDVVLFDYYKGKGIPDGKKSYGVSFYIQNEEKTLTDKEIDRIMNKISEKLQKELQAELR